MIDGMQNKAASALSVKEVPGPRNDSPSTTTMRQDGYVGFSVGRTIKLSDMPETTPSSFSDQQSILPLEDGDLSSMPSCKHWWVISAPTYRYSKGRTGVLTEETTQVCKLCGEERHPSVPVVADWINE